MAVSKRRKDEGASESAETSGPPPGADRSQLRLVQEGVGPKRRWKGKLVRLGLWAGLCGLTAAALGVFLGYYIFSSGLPAIPRVDRYWPPIVTEVYTDVAVFLIRPEGVLVRETHGMTFEQLQAVVPVPLTRV